MHFKIKRTLESKEVIPSKTLMEFHCGFRRIKVKPLFSAETNPGSNNEKLRMMKFLRSDVSAIATCICPIVFTPNKVLCFTEASLKSESVDITVATGIVMPPNPLKVILKRIILTGYPLKCHKKRAVIRYMFFEPKDIKYFKPVELYTKNGLKVSDSFPSFILLGAHSVIAGHSRPHEMRLQRLHQTERCYLHAAVQTCLPCVLREMLESERG
jgi:pre-rRNA-processing protein TSR1